MAGNSGGFGSAYYGTGGSQPAPAPSSAGGFGSAWNSRPPTPAKKQGGGLFGHIVGSVEGALGTGAHYVAQKADLAAHDVAAIPAGLLHVGEAPFLDTYQGVNQIIHGRLNPNEAGSHSVAAAKQVAQSTKQTVEHPLRDPFATALTVAPAAGVVARAGLAADAARAGDLGGAAKALVKRPAPQPRIIQVPKLVAPEGEGPAALTHEPVALHASEGSLAQVGQRLHDAIIQRSLENEAATGQPTRVSRYANRRVGKVTSEQARTANRTALVPAQMLERAGAGLHPFDKGVSKQAGQLALFLRSANVSADEAARYWGSQAARGVNATDTGKLAQLAQHIHDSGLLHVGDDGNVAVDAERFPKLGNADALTQENQASREAIIHQHGLMVPEGMQSRLDLVAEKMGVGREGQGYVPLRTSVKGLPQTGIARARPPLIGRPRFSVGKKATGSGVAKGLIPDNTTAGVARANREALRYQGTVTHRGLVARYGSDVRRTGDDVLVADPAADKYAEIPANVRQVLGQERSTLNTIPESEHVGMGAAMRAKFEDAIPGLRDNFATDHAEALGTRAPEGYKWVPRSQLGELVHETTPRMSLTKTINDVNSAVTAMTVYFKLSHIPQRLTTNATTSLFSGALTNPATLKSAIEMRKALTDREYAEAVAASGTHGYMALPHEGTGRIARGATKGAQFYARRIDSPFRFLNLVHEARKAGIETPAQFRELLDYAKNPTETNPKFQHVLGQANRASMMYDGLGEKEQRVLARGLWFYPWTKAAARFGGHTLMEHPLKSAVAGQFGVAGRNEQQQVLGDLPSYEYGLVPFSGGRTGDLSILTPLGTVANVMQYAARPGEIAGNLNPVYGAALTATTGINQFGAKTTHPVGDALSQLFAPTPEAQIVSAALHPSRPTQIFQKTPGSQAIRAVLGPSYPRATNRAALNRAAARERSDR